MIVRKLTLLSLLLALVGSAPLSSPEPAAASPEKDLAGMAWLAGTWSGDMWGGRFTAYYTTPEGGRILSNSELHQGEKLAFHEFEVFSVKPEGVHLQPYPQGRPAGGFLLSSCDAKARKAVFENPDKDYPTRITYSRVADDQLLIVLDDPHGESDKTERFELKRQ